MEQEVIGASAQLVYVLIGALVGGAGVLITFGLGIRFVLNSPVLIKALEALANSWPAEVRETFKQMGDLLVKMTDGTPEEEKTPPAPPPVG